MLNKIKQLLDNHQAPEAFELFEANQDLLSHIDAKLLYCRVLVQIGRYEMVKDIAQAILIEQSDNQQARDLLSLIASATLSPLEKQNTKSSQRNYGTSIPQPFLGRLQDAVHHYTYKGVQMVKSPFDIALYPLMIWEQKPQTIIEVGSKEGGSAIWMADQIRSFDLPTQIHSIDLIEVTAVSDPLVKFYRGNGRRLELVLQEEFLSNLPRPWLVIEDADHSEETSYAVLKFFDNWLQEGDLIVIEDGIMSDLYPETFPDYSSGPHLALKRFLGEREGRYMLQVKYCDFFGVNATWSTNGILTRIGE